MNRRQILQYTAWITGSAVSASFAGVFLTGCTEAPPAQKLQNNAAATAGLPILHFFTPEQFLLAGLIADTILPRTDSPSATDVNAHVTMDSMLGQVFNPQAQASFKKDWLALQDLLQQHDFTQKDHPAQVELLQSLELSDDAAQASARNSLLQVKQQLIAYYLSTEEIGKNFLNYLPIPGTYEPCISVDDVNNTAWAF
jgi:hypothetical protein